MTEFLRTSPLIGQLAKYKLPPESVTTLDDERLRVALAEFEDLARELKRKIEQLSDELRMKGDDWVALNRHSKQMIYGSWRRQALERRRKLKVHESKILDHMASIVLELKRRSEGAKREKVKQQVALTEEERLTRHQERVRQRAEEARFRGWSEDDPMNLLRLARTYLGAACKGQLDQDETFHAYMDFLSDAVRRSEA